MIQKKRLVIQKSLTTTKRKYDEVTSDLTKLRAIVDEANKLKKEEQHRQIVEECVSRAIAANNKARQNEDERR